MFLNKVSQVVSQLSYICSHIDLLSSGHPDAIFLALLKIDKESGEMGWKVPEFGSWVPRLKKKKEKKQHSGGRSLQNRNQEGSRNLRTSSHQLVSSGFG